MCFFSLTILVITPLALWHLHTTLRRHWAWCVRDVLWGTSIQLLLLLLRWQAPLCPSRVWWRSVLDLVTLWAANGVVLSELLVPEEALVAGLAEVAEVLVVQGDVGFEVVDLSPLTKAAPIPVTAIAGLVGAKMVTLNVVLELQRSEEKYKS